MTDWLGGWLGAGSGGISAVALPVRGGQVTTWLQNQSDTNLRQSAILISKISDGSAAPMATDFTGEVYIRLGGTTFVLASGTLTNVGYDGTWMYEATQAETDVDANEIELRIVDSTYYGQTLINLDIPGEETVTPIFRIEVVSPVSFVRAPAKAPPPRRAHVPTARPRTGAKSRAAAMLRMIEPKLGNRVG
jgi:hypothetical protein